MKRVLVTGANGQLGSALRELAEGQSQLHLVFTDVAELDITDAQAVKAFVAQEDIDAIINCAAYTAVDRAEEDTAFCALLNTDAPRFLAEAMAERGGEIIHVSTDYVFDGTAHTPYTEDVPTNPQSAYGRTKLAGEQAVLAACEQSAIVRTAWLCSPFGKNFVKTMLSLGLEGKDLRVVYDQIGTPTFAHDLAAALYTIINKGVQRGIYHYSNEGAVSWYDFAQAVRRIAAIDKGCIAPVLSDAYPTPAKRPHYSVLHKGKIKEVYGIVIPYWEDSLRLCLDRLTTNA